MEVTRIDELTKEQRDAMPSYAKKWIEIGLRTGETDWDTFDKYMPICYEKANLKYPKNVVRVQSPLVGALAASVAEGILKQRRDAVDGAVRDAVDGAVRDAVRDAVHDAVGGAVDDAVHGAVRDAVDGAVGGAVDDAVRDAVDGAVDGAVHDAVRDAVSTAISIAQKANFSLSWHYWLGGQFWVGYGWWYAVSAVNFFFDVCKLKLAKDIMERAEAYRKVSESVNYIWPNSDFVMVCARPTIILKDNDGRLHSEKGMAIQYPDGWGLYMIHGVRFEKELYEKVISGKMSFSEILKIDNTEHRLQAMRMNTNALMSETPKLIDKSDRGNELWLIENSEVNKVYDAPKVYLLGFIDPSKKAPNNKFYEEADPAFCEEHPNADEVNASHCRLTLEEYRLLQYES